MLGLRLAFVPFIFVAVNDVSLADALNTDTAASPAASSTHSLVMPAFHALAEKTQLRLAWNAHSREEHQRWREEFHTKMVELLGRMPALVSLEVKWAERRKFGGFV